MNDVNRKQLATKFRIPEGTVWANAWKMSAAVAAIGVLVAIAGAFMQSERFAFSYLYAFVTVMTIWLGSVFFVLIQHLTSAGWSVTVRRTSEFFVSGVVVLPILFLPLLAHLDTLYPWWNHHGAESGVAHGQDHAAPPVKRIERDDPHVVRGSAVDPVNDARSAAHVGDDVHGDDPHHVLESKLLDKKGAFLNQGFFFVRAIGYFAIWLWLGLTLFRKSVAQDATGDMKYTNELRRFSTYATFLFAMSLTFAGFDWVMSLEPNWYSTMFGVRIFATSAVTSFAAIIVTALGLKRAGLIGEEINTEHFHDLGKLMFGFLVFWAYISFSEFFLIWYAAIPEEVIYYHRRWDDPSWRMISIAIVVLKFIVPFYVSMSRNAKRNNGIIGFAAGWLLAMHTVEIYYWIMPYYAPFQGVQWSGIWLEAGCVMATIGIYLTAVFLRMRKHSLIAVGDPRLSRALNFQQV